MILLRYFTRKATNLIKDIGNETNPLVEEFEKYLKEEMTKGSSEKHLKEKLASSKTLAGICEAIKAGTPIDLEALDENFTEEFDKKIDGVSKQEYNELPIGSVEKEQLDILSKANKAKKNK